MRRPPYFSSTINRSTLYVKPSTLNAFLTYIFLIDFNYRLEHLFPALCVLYIFILINSWYNKLDITAIILTYNEELHIRKCLENVCPIVKKVYVVDSPSTDNTVAIW